MKNSLLARTSDRLVMVNNAVDKDRHMVQMAVVGDSRIDENKEFTPETEEVQAVLLSDIIKRAVKVEQPKNIIIKLDIESYECRAFMGSTDGNTDPFIKKKCTIFITPVAVLTMDPPVAAITMEWGLLKEAPACPMLDRFVSVLIDSGYVPIEYRDPGFYFGLPTDVNDPRWRTVSDVFWFKKSNLTPTMRRRFGFLNLI